MFWASHLLLSLQKLNIFLESVMSAGLIEDGTVAADLTKVWSLCDGVWCVMVCGVYGSDGVMVCVVFIVCSSSRSGCCGRASLRPNDMKEWCTR